MGYETLMIFGTFLAILVILGLSHTIREFNEMEREPEKYSPTLEDEDIRVTD
jgi:Na+-transporting methylmalonyl-CoA/oxaloacetate decarboxylase gamma subunit